LLVVSGQLSVVEEATLKTQETAPDLALSLTARDRGKQLTTDYGQLTTDHCQKNQQIFSPIRYLFSYLLSLGDQKATGIWS